MKILIALLFFYYLPSSTIYSQNSVEEKNLEILSGNGIFRDNLLKTELEDKKRLESLTKDFNIDKIRHTSPIPKNLSADEILYGDSTASNLPTSKYSITSADPKVRELAKQQMYREAAQDPAITKGLGLNNIVKYQVGQEEFKGGVFGFDPYKSIEENRNYYARYGYTLSYKYSDNTIYIWGGIILILVFIFTLIFSKRKNFEKVDS